MSKRADYEVVIAGGGMVGATLACALGQAGVKVALIEARAPGPEPLPADGYDLRVSAITLASRRIFENLGIWDGIARRRVNPLRAMRVWDAAGGGAIGFDAAEIGEPDLGYIVENRVIDAAAWERLAGHASVEVRRPAQIAALDVDGERVGVGLADGRRLNARLLVGADGAQSVVRELAGIAVRGWGYDQQGIVATVATTGDHAQTAFQVFLPTGPLAFLPLAPGSSSIVWSCDTPRAAALLALDDDAFRAELATAFGDRLGVIESVGPRAAFPLSLAHAERYVGERVALVGDAAHRVHPLAGQGVNLGLLDAALLAELLLAARGAGRDPGARPWLRRYERGRKGDNLAMLAVTDAFQRGFGASWAPLVAARSLGLDLTDALPPLKQAIMRRAAGLAGELPALARAAE
ncbi:MAG TPA: UbiH/UbiF/VisC/COQ6 family ubiquinone biosynthesis hydroxylase [Acidiferrobacterales bacterium]